MFFFSTPNLRAPSTDRPETLPHGQNLAEFYNPTPKIRGAFPPKKLGAKNMQNSVDFCKIRLWSRITPERIDISKIWKKTPSTTTTSTLSEKNLVNFGPQTTEIQWCILTHLNGFFSGDYNSALKGRCPFKFLHVLEIDPGYVAHPHRGRGSPQKNFNGENLKFGLKFRVCAPITSGPVGVSSRNFSKPRAARQGW